MVACSRIKTTSSTAADAGLFVHLHTLATDRGVRLHPATPLTEDDLRAGVFANRHRLRSQIVPTTTSPVPDASPDQLGLFDIQAKPRPPDPCDPASVEPVRMPRHSWSWLLAHAFAIHITHCPRRGCGGRLETVRAVCDRDELASILYGARAPSRPAPPGQLARLPT